MAIITEQDVIRGVDMVLEVEVGGSWVIVGGQQGGSLTRSADSLETTSKGTGRNRTRIAGLKDWGVDADGIVIIGDEGYEFIENAYDTGENIRVRIVSPSGRTYVGMAIIIDLPLDFGHEDLTTYTIGLEAASALEEGTAETFISPVSKKKEEK